MLLLFDEVGLREPVQSYPEFLQAEEALIKEIDKKLKGEEPSTEAAEKKLISIRR